MTVATGVPLGSWPRSITSATTPTRLNSLSRRGSRKTRPSSPGAIGSVAVTPGMMIASSRGVSVALVEQPYLVAGRRSPAPARQLDAAWMAVVDYLHAGELDGLALLVGGRSLGARVACRTAQATGAVAVLCLAFPLQPPSRA